MQLSSCCLAFSYRGRKSEEAAQHDGVKLGSNHERGEQHRRSQCAHDALLLQTVRDSAGNYPVVLLFVDDPQVMHVPGPHSQQHQTKNLCWIGLPCLRKARKNTGGDEYDRFDVGDLYCLLRCHRRFGLKFLRSAVGFTGDWQFPRAAADRCVSVHRAPSESAEEHDVLHPVLLRHGSHVLHLIHVHGEPTAT